VGHTLSFFDPIAGISGDEKSFSIQTFDDSAQETRLVSTVEQIDGSILSTLTYLIREVKDVNNFLHSTT
jgi:hypothetical protein